MSEDVAAARVSSSSRASARAISCGVHGAISACTAAVLTQLVTACSSAISCSTGCNALPTARPSRASSSTSDVRRLGRRVGAIEGAVSGDGGVRRLAIAFCAILAAMTHLIGTGLIVVLAIAGGACKKEPSVDESLAAVKPKVDAKLGVLETIAKGYKTADASKVFPGAQLAVIDNVPTPPTGNTVLAYPGDLDAIAGAVPPPTNSFRHARSIDPVECFYAVRRREYGSFRLSESSSYYEFSAVPVKGFQVPMMCDGMIQATHLAVVLTGEATGGTVAPTATDKTADKFEEAGVTGAILVYDLASGAYLGRRPWSAHTSSSVTYKTQGTGVGAELEASRAVGDDLMKWTWRAIEDAVEAKQR